MDVVLEKQETDINMILDDDNIIDERINNSIFTPTPPDPQMYRDTMKVLTMDWYRWVSEVPYKVFREVFERQIEIQQEHKGRTGEYIYGIAFKDEKVINFIFKGINNSDHYWSSEEDQVTFNILLSNYYLRDQESARRAFTINQYAEYCHNKLTTSISCSLTLDRDFILKHIYDFMISHSKHIIFQSYDEYAREKSERLRKRFMTAN